MLRPSASLILVKREHLAFLATGLAFGFLLGFGSYHAVATRPVLDGAVGEAATAEAPRGTPSPTQMGPNATGGAPMVATINRLKEQLQQDPKDFQVLLRLANLYHDAAMWPQAISYYERAGEVHSGDPDLWTDLGVCYRGAGKFDEAIASFDRAHKLDAKHWQSLYNLIVVAAFDVDRVDLAREALKAIEAIEPRPQELGGDRLAQLREAVEKAHGARGGTSGS